MAMRIAVYLFSEAAQACLFIIYCSIVKNGIKNAGIDRDQFKVHSTRAAAVSAAKSVGVSLRDIMNMADWSQECTFTRFYHKPVVQSDSVRQLSVNMMRTLFVAFNDTLSCMQAYHNMELKVLQGLL